MKIGILVFSVSAFELNFSLLALLHWVFTNNFQFNDSPTGDSSLSKILLTKPLKIFTTVDSLLVEMNIR